MIGRRYRMLSISMAPEAHRSLVLFILLVLYKPTIALFVAVNHLNRAQSSDQWRQASRVGECQGEFSVLCVMVVILAICGKSAP